MVDMNDLARIQAVAWDARNRAKSAQSRLIAAKMVLAEREERVARRSMERRHTRRPATHRAVALPSVFR